MTHVTHPIFVTHLTHDPSTHSLLCVSYISSRKLWQLVKCKFSRPTLWFPRSVACCLLQNRTTDEDDQCHRQCL